MGALLNHVVGGPRPQNAVSATEDPPGICGGGQSPMAQTVSSPHRHQWEQEPAGATADNGCSSQMVPSSAGDLRRPEVLEKTAGVLTYRFQGVATSPSRLAAT